MSEKLTVRMVTVINNRVVDKFTLEETGKRPMGVNTLLPARRWRLTEDSEPQGCLYVLSLNEYRKLYNKPNTTVKFIPERSWLAAVLS